MNNPNPITPEQLMKIMGADKGPAGEKWHVIALFTEFAIKINKHFLGDEWEPTEGEEP